MGPRVAPRALYDAGEQVENLREMIEVCFPLLHDECT